jgi:hypothetical protein
MVQAGPSPHVDVRKEMDVFEADRLCRKPLYTASRPRDVYALVGLPAATTQGGEAATTRAGKVKMTLRLLLGSLGPDERLELAVASPALISESSILPRTRRSLIKAVAFDLALEDMMSGTAPYADPWPGMLFEDALATIGRLDDLTERDNTLVLLTGKGPGMHAAYASAAPWGVRRK